MKPALLVALVFSSVAVAGEAPDPRKILNTVFPRDTEIALALTGGPAHLRDGATVYVFGAKGFEKAKDGTNGFTCLVARDGFFYGTDNFKPTCWDAEGKTSYVPVQLRVGELLAQGKTADEARADIDAGFKSGRYKRPARTGIAHMTSGDVKLDASGKVTSVAFPGHSMIYAPGVTNADIGYTRAAGMSLPFIFDSGAGGTELAYIIAVPHH